MLRSSVTDSECVRFSLAHFTKLNLIKINIDLKYNMTYNFGLFKFILLLILLFEVAFFLHN